MWLSVRAKHEEVRVGLHDLGFEGVAAFASRLIHPLDAEGRRALVDWPLERVALLYEDFIGQYGEVPGLAAQGAVAPTEALVLRTRMMDAWRTLVRLDPDLPVDLLPSSWPRARARDIFATVYDALGPLAEFRCKQIVAGHDVALGNQTWHITVDGTTEKERGQAKR